jgi:hypothetical protein
MFTADKLIYLYLWICILFYQTQDLQSQHPITNHKYDTFYNMLQESLYFCVQISLFAHKTMEVTIPSIPF